MEPTLVVAVLQISLQTLQQLVLFATPIVLHALILRLTVSLVVSYQLSKVTYTQTKNVTHHVQLEAMQIAVAVVGLTYVVLVLLDALCALCLSVLFNAHSVLHFQAHSSIFKELLV